MALPEWSEIIAAKDAEIERLVKSRNSWGQKYNKLLEKHKVTLSQLKTAVWSDSEECKFLTAEVERLRNELHIAERWSAQVYQGRHEDEEEITKLRAALTDIATVRGLAADLQARARAALKEPRT